MLTIEQKKIEEKQAEKARLKVSIAIYAKQIKALETLLENDRALTGKKLKIHLQVIQILYAIQNKLLEQFEHTSTDLDLLALKIEQTKN